MSVKRVCTLAAASLLLVMPVIPANAADDSQVTAQAPTQILKESCYLPNAINIPQNIKGVDYGVDFSGDKVTVQATAQEGYALKAGVLENVWSFTVTKAENCGMPKKQAEVKEPKPQQAPKVYHYNKPVIKAGNYTITALFYAMAATILATLLYFIVTRLRYSPNAKM